MIKKITKKFLPKGVLRSYHKALALLAAFVYGNPSDKLIVIGVTGTNGKSTTVALIAKTLEAGGFKVGATSTVSFKVADREWLNDKKMTMLGRFQLQKLLKQMVDAGCSYAVIETSSQGIEQYRHLGINYDYAVFTNLTPEHIEAHGGFENYKCAKGKMFEHLTRKVRKRLEEGQRAKGKGQKQGQELKFKNQKTEEIEKTIIANVDDEHADYFLSFNADKKVRYAVKNESADLVAKNIEVTMSGASFEVAPPARAGEAGGVKINMRMMGAFNVYNALAAAAVGLEEGLTLEQIKQGLESVAGVPGRMEVIDEGQPFTVIVDYAPEPASMGALYETVQEINKSINQKIKNTIHVLGSCGGGRDKARRPVLGRLAGKNADFVIVTNEDPYDDDPMEIINEVAAGAIEAGKELDKNLFKILDRREAIAKAIGLAEAGDLVLITGKGSERAMAVAGGKLVPWDDREIAREQLQVQSPKLKVKSPNHLSQVQG